jgi:phage/plasmid-associated DNA primase
MGAWLVEACFREPDAWEKSTELFRSYKAWAEQAGEPPLSSKQFSQKLEARGFRKQHRNTGNVFLGLRVIPQMGGYGP